MMYAASNAVEPEQAPDQSGGRARYAPELEGVPCANMRRELVGSAELRREDVTSIRDGEVMVLAQALGPPRLWGYLLDTALDAFTDGYLRAPEGSLSARLHQGMRMASHFVRARIDGLIERRGADVGVLALAFDGPSLHLLGAGTLDAYLYRRATGGVLARLGASELPEPSEGLFKGTASMSVELIEPGDVLFAGSRAACTPHVLARLNVALQQDRQLSARAIVDALGGSAAEQGLGTATLALRIPSSF